jgi:hypothetical protein
MAAGGRPCRGGGRVVTGPEDLDEWSLVGLTREQGLARWAAVFAGRPSVSRMTVSTCWGWLTWEPVDAETARVARLAGRSPTPILVEIAVRDPDSRPRNALARPGADPVTAGAWSGLTGLIAGGAAGVWWWGLTGVTLVLAVAAAVGAVAAAALWRWLAASRRPDVQVLTERDTVVTDVFAGAKVLTWVTDHLRIHESVSAGEQRRAGAAAAEESPDSVKRCTSCVARCGPWPPVGLTIRGPRWSP